MLNEKRRVFDGKFKERVIHAPYAEARQSQKLCQNAALKIFFQHKVNFIGGILKAGMLLG
jgi:hypothetical protein